MILTKQVFSVSTLTFHNQNQEEGNFIFNSGQAEKYW